MSVGKLVFGSALLISGCAVNKTPPINAITSDRIYQVEAEIKRQISVYEAEANAAYLHPETDPARQAAAASGFVCGEGKIDFDVESVTLDLTTTVDTTASGSLGLTIPVIGPAGTIGPSGSLSRDVTNTQEISLPLYPAQNRNYVASPDAAPAPIADALFGLREALIKGATLQSVCFWDYNFKAPSTDKGGTYKLGLTITDDGKGGIDIKLAIVDFGANFEHKSATGNTITVSFQQRDIPKKAPSIDPKTGGPSLASGGGLGEGAPPAPPAPRIRK